MTSMAGKTVLVTGGTGGIGLATAAGLAGLGARVGIVGRDQARAEAGRGADRAGRRCRSTSSPPTCPPSARCAASPSEVLAAYPRLDVLVNNVGGYWATRHTTEDGLERTFAVNHLAPFLLTNLLLDRLRASAPARVVTVSSGAQAMGRIDFDDLQGERSYSGQRAYNQSKLANVLFTYELARRLEGIGRHGERAPSRGGAHRLRRGGLARLDAAHAARPPAVHEEPGARSRDLDPPRVLPRRRGRLRSVLREQQAEELLAGLVRHRHRGAPVADVSPTSSASRPPTGSDRERRLPAKNSDKEENARWSSECTS